MEPVIRAKQVLAVAMVVFWTAVTNHCGLELLPALKFLACAPENEVAHDSSHCGDEKDACITIEGGLYKPEDFQGFPGHFPVPPVLLTLLAQVRFLDPGVASHSPSPATAPPELSSSWQFSFRTALSPRAPSILV